jgi:hypothetical protein
MVSFALVNDAIILSRWLLLVLIFIVSFSILIGSCWFLGEILSR